MPSSQSDSIASNERLTLVIPELQEVSLTQIGVPSGVSIAPNDQNLKLAKEFAQSLRIHESDIQEPQSPHHSSSKITAPQSAELSFGAPQIDLALPAGTMSANGLHEINPLRHRDQKAALSFGLALAARHQQNFNNSAIFCFLLEDEAKQNEALSPSARKALGLTSENLIIITAKQSDDLLWAIEEALEAADASSIVCHLPLLNDLEKQRLNFLASSNSIPTILVCNHNSSDQLYSLSSWTLRQNDEVTENFEIPTATLTLRDCKSQLPKMSWSVRWENARNKFQAVSTETGKTIH